MFAGEIPTSLRLVHCLHRCRCSSNWSLWTTWVGWASQVVILWYCIYIYIRMLCIAVPKKISRYDPTKLVVNVFFLSFWVLVCSKPHIYWWFIASTKKCKIGNLIYLLYIIALPKITQVKIARIYRYIPQLRFDMVVTQSYGNRQFQPPKQGWHTIFWNWKGKKVGLQLRRNPWGHWVRNLEVTLLCTQGDI